MNDFGKTRTIGGNTAVIGFRIKWFSNVNVQQVSPMFSDVSERCQQRRDPNKIRIVLTTEYEIETLQKSITDCERGEAKGCGRLLDIGEFVDRDSAFPVSDFGCSRGDRLSCKYFSSYGFAAMGFACKNGYHWACFSLVKRRIMIMIIWPIFFLVPKP